MQDYLTVFYKESFAVSPWGLIIPIAIAGLLFIAYLAGNLNDKGNGRGKVGSVIIGVCIFGIIIGVGSIIIAGNRIYPKEYDKLAYETFDEWQDRIVGFTEPDHKPVVERDGKDYIVNNTTWSYIAEADDNAPYSVIRLNERLAIKGPAIRRN